VSASSSFPGLLQAFFTDRLMRQQQVSAHTIASYRDTFRLLLVFAKQQFGKAPSSLAIEDLNASFVGAFLDHLERDRGNRARTRNARLAAIHSFFRYVAMQDPLHIAVSQQVLAMPSKRYERRAVVYLNRQEVNALLAAPDLSTWGGRRDRCILLIAVQTGLRVSELVTLRCGDVVLTTGQHVRCYGKGRKERCTPLRAESAAALRAWLRERRGDDTDPVFPNARGSPLSRDGIAYLLRRHVLTARRHCASLERKSISPHVLRHTAAMDLLHHGVDRSVIALWMGHENLDTVQVYLHADLALKERALARTLPLHVRPRRYRPDDELLAFLKNL